MKKRVLVALAICIGISCFSQTEKGDFLVGGSFGFRTNKNNSNFNLSPNAGYFFADNFAAGANVTLDFSKKGDVRTNEVGIGPFVRYYLGKTTVRPFLVSSFGFTSQSDKTANTKIKSRGTYFLAGLGYAAFISEDVAVEGIAAYNYTHFKNASSFNGFSLNFGFQVYINKGKMANLRQGRVE